MHSRATPSFANMAGPAPLYRSFLCSFPFFCHKARSDKGRVQLSCQCSCRTGLQNCLALPQREQEEVSFFPSLHWLRFLFKIFRERIQTPLNACYSWNIPVFSNTDTVTLNPQCTGVERQGLRRGRDHRYTLLL